MTTAALRRLLDDARPDVVRPHAPRLRPRLIHPRSRENTQVNAYDAVIRSMNQEGYSPERIATELNVPQQEVDAILATTDQDTGQPAPASDPIAQALPEVADLLAWAAAHPDTQVRTDAASAAAALNALRERRAVDAELKQITSEESQLEERLAALRARRTTLRPEPAGAKRRRPARDYDPGTVRTWGRRNGYEVPDRGQIPKKVLTAWRDTQRAPQQATAG
ncbi:Lsr2 family DNA-binding protein [Streptomyces tsukubensis]|uniref:Lsr2 family DNA-binding protein n=1 Tax=Streptomyces tsukubensis TaxID=83656 RepID=UPI003451043B